MGSFGKSLFLTLMVWKALILREALSRLFAGRTTAFWLFAEPIIHLSFFVFIFTVIRVRSVGGIDTVIWLVAGMLTFFFFRRTYEQVTSSVRSNQALFTYRQVKPIDTMLVRAGLEGQIMLLVTFLVLIGLAFLQHHSMPADPLLLLHAIFGCWLLGLGFGLISALIEELLPEVGRIISLMMMPLYLISGVILPINAVSQPWRSWLLFNPLVHAVESSRSAFSSFYHLDPSVDILYVYKCALILLFLGLLLQRRYASRLVMQ